MNTHLFQTLLQTSHTSWPYVSMALMLTLEHSDVGVSNAAQ